MRHPRWFTTAYFHLPEELGAEVRDAGFDLAALVAIEGVGAWLPDVDDWLDDARRRAVLRRAIARVERGVALGGGEAPLAAEVGEVAAGVLAADAIRLLVDLPQPVADGLHA